MTWSAPPFARVFSIGTAAASSAGIVVPAPGAINTKGGWVEATPSLSDDVERLWLYDVMWEYGKNGSRLIDVAVGAAGSEKVIAENLIYSRDDSAYYERQAQSAVYDISVSVTAGERIALRQQCSVDGPIEMGLLAMTPSMAGMVSGRKVAAIGADETSSRGTEIDPGTTANTKGAWAELTASAPADLRAVCFGVAGTGVNEWTWMNVLVDIGVGPAGSEMVVVSNLPFRSDATMTEYHPWGIPFLPVSIPEGARIAARAQADKTTDNNRRFNLVLYGVI